MEAHLGLAEDDALRINLILDKDRNGADQEGQNGDKVVDVNRVTEQQQNRTKVSM